MPRKKTHEEFIVEVFELYGDEYEILEHYKNSHEKIKVKHLKCDRSYKVRPYSLLQGHECPECSKAKVSAKNRKTNIQFKVELINLFGYEYDILSEYEGDGSPIKIRHIRCENAFETTPNSLIRSRKNKRDVLCPFCNGFKRNLDNIKQEIDELTEGEYEFIDNEYKGIDHKHKLLHKICNNTWDIKLSNFINCGNRCPICSDGISKGELAIMNVLNTIDCKFIPQYSFDDCVSKNKLRFDFAVFIEDNLVFLIEFDGKQHFEEIEYFGGEISFKETKHRDNIKNTYCRENDIPLFRIPYWKFDEIESILNKLINGEQIEVDKTSFLVL